MVKSAPIYLDRYVAYYWMIGYPEGIVIKGLSQSVSEGKGDFYSLLITNNKNEMLNTIIINHQLSIRTLLKHLKYIKKYSNSPIDT